MDDKNKKISKKVAFFHNGAILLLSRYLYWLFGEGNLKSEELLKKSRLLCGGLFFCLAYLPVLTNHVEKTDFSSFLSKNDEQNPLDLSIETANTAISNKYFDNFASKSLNGEFLASLNAISNLKNLENGSPKTSVTSSTAVAQKKEAEVIAKKIEDSAPKSVNTINVAGHTGATLVKGQIKSSFYVDARNLGIPANVIDSVIRNLSSKINFKHSLKKGDKFEVIYGKNKDMIYARITTKRTSVAAYKFTKGRDSSYYFENGEKCNYYSRGSSFGQPLAGRLSVSDKFGRRRHPVTGRIHNHSGVDLRAPYGSPVYAIQDGIVKRASTFAGYGRCVDIQHSGGYSSRYAHLSRYAVRYGSIVKKGQIIGYVGLSGVTTGPHLHLELARYSQVMNPFSVKMILTPKAVVPNRLQFNLLKKQISNAVSRYK